MTEPVTDNLGDPDAKFNSKLMADPVSGGDWFNGMTTKEARKGDLDYIATAELDAKETYTHIADIMAFYTDIVSDMVITRYGEGVKVWENEQYRVECVAQTKGIQTCPWEDAAWSSGTETQIKNKQTGTTVVVNYGTAHMAKEHNILEKGDQNPYATTVENFLKNFGDLPDYKFTDGRYSMRNNK